MNSRYALTAVVFAAALLSACGSSNDLTKEQAKTLINAAFEKSPVTHPLATGMTSEGQVTDAEYFKTPGGKYQKVLEADGLITITSKGKISNPADKKQWTNALDIALTDKGKALVTGTPNTQPAQAPMWPTVYENAVFCGKAVVDIVNINSSDDSANVDYKWHYVKPTAFLDDFHKTDPTDTANCNASAVTDASLSFERKAEVWKLAGTP